MSLIEVRQQTQHQNMTEEIQRLQLLERYRKPAAEEPEQSLRWIFDAKSRQSVRNAAGASVAFADIMPSTRITAIGPTSNIHVR